MYRIKITILILLLSLLSTVSSASNAPRVALLISHHGGAEAPSLNYDLEELAQVYLVLADNGVALELVSPRGGSVFVASNKDKLDYIQRFKQQTPALQQLGNTYSAQQALNRDYDAIFIIGGDGAMFDLPNHEATQAFISRFAGAGWPIAAVCHGPAALVNVRDKNGEYLVSGKRVNGFTRLEDQAFSGELLSQFPFILQDKLEQRGAKFVSNAPMLPFVAVDGNLITAQNPMSVADAAESLLIKLGRKPSEREPFKEEATMKLISMARAMGPAVITRAVKISPNDYDMQYLALYGFYSYGLAQNEQEKVTELGIKAEINKHFSHPQYMASLIQAYVEQDQMQSAKTIYGQLKAQYPKFGSLASLSSLISP